jgi:hypothetical protein
VAGKEAGVDAGPPASAGAGSAGMTGRGRGGEPDAEAAVATEAPPPRSREGVTVEYGDGYSVEIWPAVKPSAADGSDKGRRA